MIFISLLSFGLLIAFNISRLQQFLEAVRSLRWYMLGLVVAVQLGSYYFTTMYYLSFFAIFDHKLDFKKMYQVSLAMNFVGQAFPTGGISGFSYLSSQLHGDVPLGKITLAQLMKYIFTFGSYLIVLVLGFLLLFLSGNLSQLTSRLTLLMLLGIIILSLVILMLVSDRPRLEAIVYGIVSWINTVGKKLFRRKRNVMTKTQIESFFHEFYQGYNQLLEHKHNWLKPLYYSLGGNIMEVLTVFTVLLSLGHVVGLGTIIAGYTLANIASLVSPVTGGAGVFEATMVATFVALGLPFALAFTAVLVYRVFNFAIFLPIGFYFYQKNSKKVA